MPQASGSFVIKLAASCRFAGLGLCRCTCRTELACKRLFNVRDNKMQSTFFSKTDVTVAQTLVGFAVHFIQFLYKRLKKAQCCTYIVIYLKTLLYSYTKINTAITDSPTFPTISVQPFNKHCK